MVAKAQRVGLIMNGIECVFAFLLLLLIGIGLFHMEDIIAYFFANIAEIEESGQTSGYEVILNLFTGVSTTLIFITVLMFFFSLLTFFLLSCISFCLGLKKNPGLINVTFRTLLNGTSLFLFLFPCMDSLKEWSTGFLFFLFWSIYQGVLVMVQLFCLKGVLSDRKEYDKMSS